MKNAIKRRFEELGVLNSVAAVYFGLGIVITEIMFVLGLAEVFYDFGEALTTYLVYYHLIGFIVISGSYAVEKILKWFNGARFKWTVEK